MNKLSTLALLSTLLLAAPAFADDTPSGVASDVGAVQKDNAALGKDNTDLAKDRAAKAKAKATGDMTGQAKNSLSIGADKVKKSEKQMEKSSDQKTLNSDVNDATTK